MRINEPERSVQYYKTGIRTKDLKLFYSHSGPINTRQFCYSPFILPTIS